MPPADRSIRVTPGNHQIFRLRDDVVPPLGGSNRLISPQTLLVPNEDASHVASSPMIADSFDNATIEFPLDPISGAAPVENDNNWGVGTKGLQADRFWSQGFRGAGVRIGIADSGVDATHPAFAGMMGGNRLAAFAHFNKLGTKQVQHRLDNSAIPDMQAAPTFSHWHGTHCASILVGSATSGKARGMAPEATLVVTRVLEDGNEGSVAGIMAGLSWLAEQGCDIASLSLGWPGRHEEWAAQITNLLKTGTVVVAAVGNEYTAAGVGKSRSPANYPIDPTGPDDGLLIAVGAHDVELSVWDDSGGEMAEWAGVQVRSSDGSSRPSIFAASAGRIVPTLVAPGVNIVSAIPGGKYYSSPGSSMAAPHIAGLIALVLSALRTRRPATTPRTAADLVLLSLVDISPPGTDERSGHGRVDVDALLTRLAAALV